MTEALGYEAGKTEAREGGSLGLKTLGDMRVDGVTIEEIYRRYGDGQYRVNRRYQRKLVWTTEQKERLIDSIASGLPIPLILLAEIGDAAPAKKSFEIIDGLQRLHAITAFINNDFTFDGKYFDLETIATTKARKDNPDDVLNQKTPILDRDSCVRIVNYQVPVSSYSTAQASSVDEVFRRINSSGRQLSRQEVRQAGLTTGLAGLVRKISARIRGDATLSDDIPLANIPAISIRNSQEEGPGIDIDNVFWVSNKILRRDDLRASLDEQTVLDVILDLMDVKESLSTDNRDKAYDESTTVGSHVASQLRKFGTREIEKQFDEAMGVCEALRSHIRENGNKGGLMEFMGRPAGNPSGRYFHVFFMAVIRCHDENLALSSDVDLADAVKDIYSDWSINPGGYWTFDDRRRNISKFQALIKSAFSERCGAESANAGLEILQNQLRNCYMENERFELKIGLLELNEETSSVKSNMVDKLLKIATAIANVGPNGQGRIYIGIPDNDEMAAKYCAHYGIEPLDCYGGDQFNFKVLGVDHEIERLGESLDTYVGRITKKFMESSLVTNVQFLNGLVDGVQVLRIVGRDKTRRHVIAINVPQVSEPVEFDQSYWVKKGSDMIELKGQFVVEKYKQFEMAR